MLIAREDEEIVCSKGSTWGRLTGDANDQIIDGDFAARRPLLSLYLLRPACDARAGSLAG